MLQEFWNIRRHLISNLSCFCPNGVPGPSVAITSTFSMEQILCWLFSKSQKKWRCHGTTGNIAKDDTDLHWRQNFIIFVCSWNSTTAFIPTYMVTLLFACYKNPSTVIELERGSLLSIWPFAFGSIYDHPKMAAFWKEHYYSSLWMYVSRLLSHYRYQVVWIRECF